MTDSIPDGVMSPDSPYARGLQKPFDDEQNRQQDEVDKVNGYHVVPRQLVLTSNSLHDISDEIDLLANTLNMQLGEHDLGIIGRLCDPPTPGEYNEVLSEFLEKFKKLTTAVRSTAGNVKRAADYYVAQDDEAYRGFEKLNPDEPVPPPEAGPGRPPSAEERRRQSNSSGMDF